MVNALIEEFTDWLEEAGAADPAFAAEQAETFLQWRGSVPLVSLDDDAIRAFLLDWCPGHLSLPADRSWEVCESVGEFVQFLGWTGRLRGGPPHWRSLMRTMAGLADTMRTKMGDPSRYAMPKSLLAGLQGAASDENSAKPIVLPFRHSAPTESEVATAAAAGALAARVQALRDYLGDTGRVLTTKGNLTLADGRALVEILDTDDEIDPTFGDATFPTLSTATLWQLRYLLALAEKSGAVRYVDDRLVPVAAWAAKSPIETAESLFRTVLTFGVLSMRGARDPFGSDIDALLDDGMLYWLAVLLAPGAQVDFDDLVELNQQVVLHRFDDEEADYSDNLDEKLSRILEVLDATGVIAWSDRQGPVIRWGRRVWSGGVITMTAFGQHVLPQYLPAAGIVFSTALDDPGADLDDLIVAMNAEPEEHHSSLLAAWKPLLPAAERAGLVAALITDADTATTRLNGFHLLSMFETDVAEPHMRQLLDTGATGHAAIWLLDHGLAEANTVAEFITPAVMVDILSQLLEHHEVLCEQFLVAHDPERMLESFWRHRAPETAAVLDSLGKHLPDRSLAKKARRAAIRHRSWMANGGLG